MSELLEPVTMSRDFVKVTREQSIDVIDLWLPEQLDSGEFDRLNDSMMRVLDGRLGGSWVLDLSSVSYMGSSVLGLMVNIRQHIKSRGGKLALAGLAPPLAFIFRTCCLERLFLIHRNREDAVRALGGV